MVFRRKGSGADIVVVGGEDVDEVDFDAGPPQSKRKKTAGGTERIRISEEEKQVFDLLDGKRSVADIIEMIRTAAPTPSAEAQAPVDELEVAETPVPLPLVLFLAVLAIASIVTSFKNPLNWIHPIGTARASAPVETVKAISIERIHSLGEAIEKYHLVNGHLPPRLQDLAPFYISPSLLNDPWGNPYKYLQQPSRYLVIGFTPDGKADTDLFLSRAVDTGATASGPTKQERGGITLID